MSEKQGTRKTMQLLSRISLFSELWEKEKQDIPPRLPTLGTYLNFLSCVIELRDISFSFDSSDSIHLAAHNNRCYGGCNASCH